MTLVLGHITDNPAEAVVLVSELEAGGFHPFLFDYHHGQVAIAYIGALGGYRIMLPKDEMEEAKLFLQARRQYQDYDTIKPTPWLDIIRATILSTNPLFPFLLMPPLVLLVSCLGFMILWSSLSGVSFFIVMAEFSILLFIICLLAHAKYIALPKLRERL